MTQTNCSLGSSTNDVTYTKFDPFYKFGQYYMHHHTRSALLYLNMHYHTGHNSLEELNIISDNVVGGNDEVVLWDQALESSPDIGWAGILQWVKVRKVTELLDLIEPVSSQSGWAYYQ